MQSSEQLISELNAPEVKFHLEAPQDLEAPQASPVQVNPQEHLADIQVPPIHVNPEAFRELLKSLTLPKYHLRGLEKYNPELVQQYRTFRQETYPGLNRQDIQFLPLLNEIATELLGFIEACNNQLVFKGQASSSTLTGIANELSRFTGSNQLTSIWFFSVLFRTAAALKEASAEELEVFRHAAEGHNNPELIERLFKYRDHEWGADAWSHADALMAIANTGSRTNIGLSLEVSKKLEEQLDAKFPTQVYYPIMGENKLGITLLLSLYLEQVGLLGLSDKPADAHGVSMSPLIFMAHDLFHIQNNRKSQMDAVFSYAGHAICAHVKESGIADLAVEPVVSIVVQKHITLAHTFQTVLQHFLTSLYPERGLDALNKAIAGFFYSVHEVPEYVSVNTYLCSELEEILNKLCDAGIEHVSSEQSWESPADPFCTSPETGEILLSKEDQTALMQKLTRQRLQQERNTLYFAGIPVEYYSKSDSEKLEYLESLITDVTLENNGRFIDLKITFRDGKTLYDSMPTLFHKWHNADDAIGLLKLARIRIKKPNLQEEAKSLEEQRQLVIQTLIKVQDGLKETINFFRQEALHYATREEPETGMTLAARYRIIFENMQRELKEKLDRCKKPLAPFDFETVQIRWNPLPGFQRHLTREREEAVAVAAAGAEAVHPSATNTQSSPDTL
ncbi:MAG TPA: hypothetical protein PK583_01250 [Gammaproteobacteria bacterium]|nr:hypothetical protein [Gammaproteobacteria bacterium]